MRRPRRSICSDARLSRTALLVLGMVMLACGPARAQRAYDPATGGPPMGGHQHYTTNRWEVTPTAQGAGIRGTCILDCYVDDNDEIHMELKGLKPNGIYTVWLTRKDGNVVTRAYVARQWEGKDAENCTLESRGNGEANYHGWFHQCPLGKWRTLEVRYHPDGQVKNLQGSIPVIHIPLKGS